MQWNSIFLAYFANLLDIINNTMWILRSRSNHKNSFRTNYLFEMRQRHPFILINRYLYCSKSNIMTSLVNSRMPSHRHYNLSNSSIFPISFHGKQQTFCPTACNISNTLLITIKQGYSHLHNFILNNS